MSKAYENIVAKLAGDVYRHNIKTRKQNRKNLAKTRERLTQKLANGKAKQPRGDQAKIAKIDELLARINEYEHLAPNLAAPIAPAAPVAPVAPAAPAAAAAPPAPAAPAAPPAPPGALSPLVTKILPRIQHTFQFDWDTFHANLYGYDPPRKVSDTVSSSPSDSTSGL